MDTVTVISVIVGGILAAWIFEDSAGWLTGMLLGFLLAKHFTQKRTLVQIEKRLQEVEDLIEEIPEEEEPKISSVINTVQEENKPTGSIHPVFFAPEPPSSPLPSKSIGGKKEAPPEPAVTENAFFSKLSELFTQGNVVLRVGLLVLFFGVAFLLKYAADRNVIPIELRLFTVAMGGLALLGFGWLQRQARPGFALLVQGGGIGIMYLTVFAAFKLYHLVPTPLAFGLMLGLVAASTALALLQDSSPLALFGAAGGFLAPVLLSTGSGNHVALFSYYALLNSGILAVSWFKAWRSLNLLGFVFILGIGAAWGLNSYQPELFATAEPFLILFFLMFNAIGVLFAFRQPPNLRGYVDGTLVFGTPVVCFSLQAGMVQDMPHGLAYSALAMSLFYVVLATFLWNKGDERLRQGMRTMTEAFLALGVVFVTLAVPLALSGRWTAVTWAMEGAALIWVGIRQNRVLARSTGFLLQFGAGFFFLADLGYHGAGAAPLPLLNGTWLGSAIIAVSALFSSWQLYKADNLRRWEQWNHLPLFFWGGLWWFCAGMNEIPYGDNNVRDHAMLLFNALSCAVMARLAVRLNWPPAAWPSLCLPLFMLIVMQSNLNWKYIYPWNGHLFGGIGVAAWPLAFMLLYHCLRKAHGLLKEHCLRLTHGSGFLLLTLTVIMEALWHLRRLTGGAGVWDDIAWGLIPTGMVLLAHSRRLEAHWPLADYAAVYQRQASAVLAFFMWLWLLAGYFGSAGDAPPLPFIPVVNPLELSQLAVMLLLVWWTMRHHARAEFAAMLAVVGAGTVFLWLNTALARAVHHFAAVPFDADAMLDSRLYQTSLAILWALLSLALMRRQSRTLWFAGCVLIGATVLKLFLIDLANSGAAERIVSFISVGLLVIAISYFSPLPPKKEEAP
ncbi:MAG: putative membrane protein [Candidatus Electronema aureum]|uniref:Membrane protein n=1 Tax=Candidatus Electronema aureum TaxID=2005002 RepID=A0A521G3T3_9BACT|nr:MAG: putative membrane protein [Candidatus Electronema aureum]